MFDSTILLIGLGAQKAGTSWLSRYLAGHPEVFIPAIKELHYFDRKYADLPGKEKKLHRVTERFEADKVRGRNRKRLDTMAERLAHLKLDQIKDDASYLEFFRQRVGDRKVFGDLTPTYSTLDATTFAIMNRMHPDVRFLFVLRDPIERSWSQFCFARRFKERHFTKEEFGAALNRPSLALRSDYKRTIEELEKAVPKDRIKVVFFENLFSEQGIREITEFLRIQPRLANFQRDATANRKPPLDPELAQLAFNRLRHVYDFVAERFGDNLPQRWREAMEVYGEIAAPTDPNLAAEPSKAARTG